MKRNTNADLYSICTMGNWIKYRFKLSFTLMMLLINLKTFTDIDLIPWIIQWFGSFFRIKLRYFYCCAILLKFNWTSGAISFCWASDKQGDKICINDRLRFMTKFYTYWYLILTHLKLFVVSNIIWTKSHIGFIFSEALIQTIKTLETIKNLKVSQNLWPILRSCASPVSK